MQEDTHWIAALVCSSNLFAQGQEFSYGLSEKLAVITTAM